MRYSLHPEAAQDLREAAQFYYERGGPALSQSLLAEFERAVQLLLRHPQLGSRWRHGKRRYVLRRFPYSLVYSTAADEVRVVAVAHHSRHPSYWGGRK